ncbi:MAG: tetratricopeptide repeat protein [Sphingomonas sp.]|jgi:Flp pilus assembly protein TadD|uniref:tetratricopeptide repeat protein n=1 Tax=Sphingomonas sp. TaxID=28214 RepID=UPI0035663A6E
MTIFAVAIAIALAGLPAAPEKQTDFDPQAAAVNRAERLVADGKLDEATLVLDPALEAYQRQFGSETRAIYCSESPAEALQYMTMSATAKKSAVAIGAGWCTALFLKGYILDDGHHYSDAAVLLERAVTMAPHHAHYLNELGFAYQRQRNWPASDATYRRAAESAAFDAASLKVERGRAWRGLGYNLVEEGKLDEAEAMYRKCLELDPNDTKSQGELRWIAEQRKRHG